MAGRKYGIPKVFRSWIVKRCCVKEFVCLNKRILQCNEYEAAKQGMSRAQILPLDKKKKK
jgi:hypothetical protein